MSMSPVRKVLLDAYGTIFSPRPAVFVQYAEVAQGLGLQVEESRVKTGFKTAYRQWAASHPLYGKLAIPPLTPATWWANVIRDTFLHAGVAPHLLVPPLLPSLTATLTQRFWSRDGYAIHPDVIPFLDSLPALGVAGGAAVVSGSDPDVVRVLQSLEVLSQDPKLRCIRVREDEVWTSWEMECEKRTPVFWERVLERMNGKLEDGVEKYAASDVLVVGDELVSDYETPRAVGFQSLLLRRQNLMGEHARASYNDESETDSGVDVIQDLVQVSEWIRCCNK